MKTKTGSLILLLTFLLSTACNTATQQGEKSQSESKDWEYQMTYQRGIEAMIWSVPAVSIDDFYIENKVPRIDLIKIDTDGHELRVLKGARRTVAKYREQLGILPSKNRKRPRLS